MNLPERYRTPAGPNLAAIVRDAAILLILGVLIGGSWFVTNAGTRSVVTRMGAVDRIVSEGLNWKIPLAEAVHTISIRADSVKIEKAEGGTHDQQPVHVDLVVRYEIRPEEVKHIFTQLARDGDMDRYVNTATAEVFKAVTARFTAPQLLTERQKVSSEVVSSLQTKVDQFGLRILSVDMTQFAFEPAYMQAISEKVRQEQNIATQRNVLERIEVEQQQKVKAAEAEATALRARTDAEAYQTERLAAAKAKAIQLEAQALRENANLLELRKIEVERAKAERWNGALPTSMYAGAPMPFMSVGKDK